MNFFMAKPSGAELFECSDEYTVPFRKREISMAGKKHPGSVRSAVFVVSQYIAEVLVLVPAGHGWVVGKHWCVIDC